MGKAETVVAFRKIVARFNGLISRVNYRHQTPTQSISLLAAAHSRWHAPGAPPTMPPRKPGKAAARERKPAMKRGGRVSTKPSGGSVKASTGGGGGKNLKGLQKARIPKGDAAAHKQQAYYDVDEEDDDFGGRGARENEEFGDAPKGQFDDLPDDFEDEEIDEDEAFTEEDKRRYGDVNWDSFTSGKKKQKHGGGVDFSDDDGVEEDFFDEEDPEDVRDEEEQSDEEELLLDSDEDDDELDEDEDKEGVDDDVEEEGDFTSNSEEDMDPASDSEEGLSSDDDDNTDALLRDVVGEVRENRMTNEKQLSRRRLRRGLTEAIPESEFGTAPGGRGGFGTLSVASLMAASLGGGVGEDEDAEGQTKKPKKNPLAGAQKRLDKLASNALKPVAAPLPKLISERVERKAAYEAIGAQVSEWQDIVKTNREKPTLKFTDQERDKMNRVKNLASMNANFDAGGSNATDFEKLIMAKIKSSGLETGRDVEKAEDLQLNALTAEEANERRARLAKMRNLLFRHELKAKRVKAIKSKTFHRHNRKTGAVKMIGGDGDEIGDDDHDLEGLKGGDSAEQRREYLRAQERMLLKHKNTSRWAKRAIRKGLAHLPGTKEAIAEQLRLGQELRRKIGIGGERGEGETYDDQSEDSETDASDSDDAPLDDQQAERKRLAKAKTLTLKAIEQGTQDAETQGGLFALPFMAKALRKKREAAEIEAKALLEDIENAEREAANGEEDNSDGEQTVRGNRAGDWGAGALGFKDDNITEVGDVGPVTRRTFGGASTRATRRAAAEATATEDDADDAGDDTDERNADVTNPEPAELEPKRARGSARAAARTAAASAVGATEVPDLKVKPLGDTTSDAPRELPRGAGAAKARNAARQAGRAGVVDVVAMNATVDGNDDDNVAEHGDDTLDEDTNEALLARAFAGDDVVANFETEKTAEVEGELPKFETQKRMPGWGGWAEEQAKRPIPKWQIESERKAEAEKAKALKLRKDAKLQKVIISEKYDKKAAAFNVEHLPHGFESKQVYEGSMRAPLGSDVNTDKSFRDLTRPKVLKNAGAVIRPMTLPKKRKVSK